MTASKIKKRRERGEESRMRETKRKEGRARERRTCREVEKG